jgi:hypothetical protein
MHATRRRVRAVGRQGFNKAGGLSYAGSAQAARGGEVRMQLRPSALAR